MQTTKLLFVLGLGATLVAFALTSGAGDTAAQTKAREALRQKMSELDTPSATSPPPAAPAKPATPPPPAAPPQAVAPAVAPQKKAPVAPAAPAPVAAPAATAPNAAKFAPVPAAVEADNTARAREALRQQTAKTEFGPVTRGDRKCQYGPRPRGIAPGNGGAGGRRRWYIWAGTECGRKRECQPAPSSLAAGNGQAAKDVVGDDQVRQDCPASRRCRSALVAAAGDGSSFVTADRCQSCAPGGIAETLRCGSDHTQRVSHAARRDRGRTLVRVLGPGW